MKILGTHDRSEFVLDRSEAWRRGRELDRMLAAAAPPRQHGVLRASHAEMNQLDDLRALEIARRLNSAAARRGP